MPRKLAAAQQALRSTTPHAGGLVAPPKPDVRQTSSKPNSEWALPGNKTDGRCDIVSLP